MPHRFDFVLRPIIPPFRLNFKVKAKADAIVALAGNETEASVFAEIGIGGWSNSKSSIRACYSQICQKLLGDDAVHDETGIISDVESRPFWIEYKGGVVTVGKGGQTEAFMEWDAKAYHMKSPVPVHVGISTYHINRGNWTFYQFCP
ncbi:C3 and PZP-like alpha-2-macroglobulin domain-containing protein 8 [Acanthaster planci]|uniref:C3 and PZP-like alpha-2-macroglobulin domain-containing protein 8 n=1 Tax=Acanthaster planci TaxID=133434 RepID=A0A8B7Z9Z7_ACAPL|nr:C3 and PZP-like alpha-2-macroglobulin domain-containing protein 8 [Acanthaster planci]